MKKIEIDIEDLLGHGEESISDQVIKQVSVHIAREISDKVKSQVNGRVEKLVDKKIQEIVDRYFEKGMTETDMWGNERPNANKKTLPEIVMSEFDKYLKREVNSRGETASYNDGKMSMMTWIAQNAAKKLFDEKMKPEIDKIVSQVKNEIGNKMSDEFKKAMMKIVGL